MDALLDLLLQAVVEVVVHLLDEFVVGERVEVEIVVGHRGRILHKESIMRLEWNGSKPS